jgi:hypothetical protein
MRKAKATRRRKPLTYGDYGKVRVLQTIATDRGGLTLIRAHVSANRDFPRPTTVQFWVRTGALTRPRPIWLR